MIARLKDAGLAGLAAFGLSLPMLGLETIDAGNGKLGLATHFDRVAITVAMVFLGRLFLSRVRLPKLPAKFQVTRLPAVHIPWAPFFIVLALILPVLPFASRYVVDLATTVLIYVMLGSGLNVVVGLAGLLDLGYVAFYAVGAYSFALLAKYLHFTFWEALPLAGLFAGSFGLLLGFPVLRLRGDYLAIVTLGFGEIIRIILINLPPVTGGPNGIDVPRPSFFGLAMERSVPKGMTSFAHFFNIGFDPMQRVWFLYYIVLALLLAAILLIQRLRRLPVGRAWEALREDEIASRALGIDPTKTKLSAFAIGAMLAGFAGCFFATRQGFISPESFTFMESATILAIVVLGGMGSQLGVVLASLVLVGLPEVGRQFAEFRMILFGMAMIAIMVWRPKGLLSHRQPTIKLSTIKLPKPGAGV